MATNEEKFERDFLRAAKELSKRGTVTDEDIDEMIEKINNDEFEETRVEVAYTLASKAAHQVNKKKAIKLCNDAIDIDNNCIYAYNVLASMEKDPIIRIEKYKENIERCRKILDLDNRRLSECGIENVENVEQYIVTKATLVGEHIIVSRYSEAINLAEEVLFLTKGNDFTDVREELMLLYSLYEKKESMDNLLQLFPDSNLVFYLAYSIYYFKIGEYTKAKEELLKSREINTHFLPFLRNPKRINSKIDNNRLSDKEYECVRALDKSFFLISQVPYYVKWLLQNI